MAEPLRVAIMADTLSVGGTQRVVASLGGALGRDSVEVTAIGLRAGGPREAVLRAAGVEVAVCGGDLARFRAVLQARRIEVLHINRAGGPEPGPVLAAAQAGVRAIVETNVFGLVDASPSGRLIDVKVFVSHTCRDRYRHWTRRRDDPAAQVVIYNPVDGAHWRRNPAERRAQFRQAYGIPADAVVFGFVAQKARWGQRLLRGPIARFIRRLEDLPWEWRLACVGLGEQEMHVCRNDPVLARRVVPVAEVSDDEALACAYHGLDVYVHFANLGEACPTVIQEAMACGKPAVVRYVRAALNNGQCEVVDNGVTGVVVAGRVDELARASAELAGAPALRARLGAASQAKADRLFDLAAVLPQYLAAYVLAGRQHQPDRLLPGALASAPALAQEMLARDDAAASAWAPRRLRDCRYGCSALARLGVRLGRSPWLYAAKNLARRFVRA